MNTVSKFLVAVLVSVSLLTSSCALFQGSYPTDDAITLAATELLKYMPIEKARVVASYIDYVSTQIRTIHGVPTKQEFLNILLQYVPQDIKTNYPELVTFVSNQVAKYYQQALDKYGNNAAQIYAVMSKVADDLEVAAKPYLPLTRWF